MVMKTLYCLFVDAKNNHALILICEFHRTDEDLCRIGITNMKKKVWINQWRKVWLGIWQRKLQIFSANWLWYDDKQVMILKLIDLLIVMDEEAKKIKAY